MTTFSLDDARSIGEELGIDWETSTFPPEQLLAGMLVELEHGTATDPRVNVTDDDPVATAKIAWAHLLESPDYYVLLAEMEKSIEDAKKGEEKKARYKRATTIEDTFDEAAEHINQAIELLRDLADLPGDHEEVIDDLIDEATDLMLALDEQGQPEVETEKEATVKRFRQPRERTAVIKPCRQKDYDPDRPKSEQRVCLYTKDGKRLLGRHPNEEAARKQEVAIKAKGGAATQAALSWMVNRIAGTTRHDHFSIYNGTRQLVVANHTNRTAAIFSRDISSVRVVNYEKIVQGSQKRATSKKLVRLIQDGYVPPSLKKGGVTYVPDLDDPETRRRWRLSQKRFSNLP